MFKQVIANQTDSRTEDWYKKGDILDYLKGSFTNKAGFTFNSHMLRNRIGIKSKLGDLFTKIKE